MTQTTIQDAEILLTPIGMGKTEYLIETLVQSLNQPTDETSPTLLRAWVLLATKRQETAFRQRLSEAVGADQGVFFNVEFFNFYELYTRLLDMNAQPQRLLDHAQRLKLLADVVNSVRDELTIFQNIADKVGFLEILSNFIDELKQHQIESQIFAQSATTAKDRDILTIYRAYQERLIEHRLVDREGQGWLTADALAGNDRLTTSVDLLLVDGFDQFTPLQANVLSYLSRQVKQVKITLTHIPQRADTIGRRFSRALETLKIAFGDGLKEKYHLTTETFKNQHADLRHLTANIFHYNAPQQATSGGIRLIEAPDQAAEVANVLRIVKGMLLEGVQPDQILIALRDWGTYQTYFSTYTRLYDLPITLHYGEPLLNNPAVVALMDLLKLPQLDFKYRDVVDTLRSPYWQFADLPPEMVQTIIELGTLRHVVGGRKQWQDAILSGYPHSDREKREETEIPAPEIDTDMILSAFNKWADAITPPEVNTLADTIAWLEHLIGADIDDPDRIEDPDLLPAEQTITLISTIRQNADETIISRDITALHALKSALKTMLITDDLMQSLGNLPPVLSWKIFYDGLKSTLSQQSINRTPSRFGQVLVTTVADARGLPHEHVFIMGLSEGIFPAPIKADPLYLDNERETMHFEGHPRLQTQAERHADDGLFYELISIPTHSLTLSRPAYEDGKEWLASNLWRQVTALFSDSEAIIRAYRQPLGEPVALSGAITFDEVATAVIHVLTHNPHDEIALQALAWLSDQAPELVNNIETAVLVESMRYTPHPLPHYDGQITPELLAELQSIVGAEKAWSASRLNQFGDCGFRFFGEYVLRLEELTPPVEGLDVLQQGNIYHKILEATYIYVKKQGMTIEVGNLEAVLKQFEIIAEAILDNAPEEEGFRPDALWSHERRAIKKRLRLFIEKDFNGEGGFSINRKSIPLTNRRPDELEKQFFYEVDIDGEPLKLVGYIDRVDLTDQGYVVLDYKSGSQAKSVKDTAKGRDLQILLYIRALEAKNKRDIFGGGFWMLGTQNLTGAFVADNPEHQDYQAQAWSKIKDAVQQARAGQFHVDPVHSEKGKCNAYCKFSKMCRFSISYRGGGDD